MLKEGNDECIGRKILKVKVGKYGREAKEKREKDKMMKKEFKGDWVAVQKNNIAEGERQNQAMWKTS